MRYYGVCADQLRTGWGIPELGVGFSRLCEAQGFATAPGSSQNLGSGKSYIDARPHVVFQRDGAERAQRLYALGLRLGQAALRQSDAGKTGLCEGGGDHGTAIVDCEDGAIFCGSR